MLTCLLFSADPTQRWHQIISLSDPFNTVLEKSPNSIYEIHMPVPTQEPWARQAYRDLIVTVHLPPDFPAIPPRIIIANEKHRCVLLLTTKKCLTEILGL